MARCGFLLPPLVLPLLMFWPRITGGGFSGDDWANRATMMHSHFGTVMQPVLDHPIGHRVLHAPYVWLYSAVFGSHQHWYLFWGVLTAGILGMLVAVLLTRVGVSKWAASAIGALGAVYPYATMTKLWFTAHVGHITGALAVGGVLIALRGLEQHGRLRRVLYHAAALACFLLSVEIYEIALPIVCASGLFYLAFTERARSAHGVPSGETIVQRFRPAVLRWTIDVAVMVAWYLSLSSTAIPRAEAFSLADRLQLIFVDGARTITGSFIPFLADENVPGIGVVYSGAWFGNTITAFVVEAVCVFALACIAVPTIAKRFSDGVATADARRIRLWGLGIAMAIVAAYAGWLSIIPTTDYYRPVAYDAPAMRINVIAAFGLAAIVVCTIGALVEITRVLFARRHPLSGPALGAVLLAAVTMAYARHDRSEIGLWNQASDEQARILRTVADVFGGKPPLHGTVVLLADSRGYVANGAEVFYTIWSFRGALQTVYDDNSLDGLGFRDGAKFQCRRNGLAPFGIGYKYADPAAQPAPYARTTVILSLKKRKKWEVTTRDACRQAVTAAGLNLLPDGANTPPMGTT